MSVDDRESMKEVEAEPLLPPQPPICSAGEFGDEVEDWDEEEEGDDPSSDSDIGEALDWLDARDDDEVVDGSFALNARRPNAHGGHGARPNSSALPPLSNKAQKLASHICASPLEGWEAKMKVGMSNSVTTAIRDGLRETEIGKSKSTDKADLAKVEQTIDPRTWMVLFRMLNRGVFNVINGCISTGKDVQCKIVERGDTSMEDETANSVSRQITSYSEAEPSSSSSSNKKPVNKKSSFSRRQLALMKKAEELSTLCGIDVCVICYGPDGALETWPKETEKVKDMALKYKGLAETERCKKSLNLSAFLEKTEDDSEKKGCGFVDLKTRLDGFSAEELSELDGFLERKLQILKQRLRALESE